jgi:hypothetical protein
MSTGILALATFSALSRTAFIESDRPKMSSSGGRQPAAMMLPVEFVPLSVIE